MNPFYRTIRTVFRPILRVYNRMEVAGQERVPRSGPAILVANHHSYMDSFVLGAACPRKIRFMVKASQFYKRGTRWFYWGMDAYPVNQDGRDFEAMRTGIRILQEGGLLGVFPAGSRNTRAGLGEWRSGVAVLARRTGAPVVPAAILGTHEAFPVGAVLPRPRRVRVLFGSPVAFTGGPGRGDLEEFVEDLRRRVGAMLATGRPFPPEEALVRSEQP